MQLRGARGSQRVGQQQQHNKSHNRHPALRLPTASSSRPAAGGVAGVLAPGVCSSRATGCRRTQLVVRAQIIADKPTAAAQPDHAQASSLGHAAGAEASIAQHSDSNTPSAAGGSCPFLNALNPPEVPIKWHQRLWQLTKPYEFQQLLLDQTVQEGNSMVAISKGFGFSDAYMTASGDAVKAVFAGEAGSDPIVHQSRIPSFVKLMGTDSLIQAADTRHRYLRGLLAPAFTPEAVASYLPQIVELMQRHLGEWADAGEEGVKGLDALKLLTFEFIVGLTFGRPYSRQELLSLTDTYRRWVMGFPAWPWLNIPFTPFGNAMKARETMISHFQDATDEGRARLARGEECPGLLGNLLRAVDEEGNRLTDSEITDNVLLLLLAGHDTSSTTLTQCFSNLQDHPEVLEKLREEQRAIIAKRGEQITPAVLKEMTYADAVIKETLRRDPVVAGLVRVAAKDFELSGYEVPEGKAIMLPLKYLAAHDPRWAGQEGDLHPDAFVPERMMGAEAQKTGDLLPFGYGPRYCLGAGLAMVEMKVLLALVARHYTFTADNSTEWVNAIGRVPKNRLPMVVKPLATKA